MSEKPPELIFSNFTADPIDRAKVYIGDDMNAGDREAAENLALYFADFNKPMASTAVMIPVAANQDAGYIFSTMEQYASQRNCQPFTLFLLLNSPMESTESEGPLRAFSEVDRAREAFPNLDIRAAGIEYSEDVTIGQIRRDLWNAAFMLAYVNKRFLDGDKEVLGINHDIDSMFISPHYISRVQKYYEVRQRRAASVGMPHAPVRPVGTRVSHAVLPSHPNVGKVTKWIDNSYFQRAEHVSYEAGMVIPFSHYAISGGFDADDRTHETRRFTLGSNLRHITGAHLYTSPRRFIDRVAQHGTGEIWTPESFGPMDACRDALKPDITTEQAEDLIMDRLQEDIQEHWLYGHMHPLYRSIDEAALLELDSPKYAMQLKEKMRSTTAKQIAKAERFMRHVLGSEILAAIVKGSIDVDEYATDRANNIINLHRSWIMSNVQRTDPVDNSGRNL